MLQILSLIAMEAPCRNDATEIRREKTKFFLPLHLEINWSLVNMKVIVLKRVLILSESMTPTYVAGSFHVNNWRWKGVPFYFMTGKKMPYQGVEVVIKLKEPPLNLV